MATSFAQQWGPALQKAGYTQIFDAFYRGDKWRRLLSFREKLIIECLISYQNDPRIGSMPSAKQLAYDSGVSYNQTRNLLKRLTNPVLDASGATVRSTLLIPVLLKSGRTRYSMTPLKYELERLEKFPAEVVRKPRPAPKPAKLVVMEDYAASDFDRAIFDAAQHADPDAAYQKAYAEPDEDAAADWEEVKARLMKEIPAKDFDRLGLAYTHGERWQDETLIVLADSSSQIDALQRWRMLIRSICRQMFGNVSLAFKTLAAAALPF